MKKTNRCAILIASGLPLVSLQLDAQYPVNALGSPTLVDFTGYTAAGLVPTPAATQVDSDYWIVHGINNSVTDTFGGTYTAVQNASYAKGTDPIPTVNDTGLFNYTDTINGGTGSFGFHPGGNDLKVTGAAVVMRLLNNTGVTATKLVISYELWLQNDGAQATTIDLRGTPAGTVTEITAATAVPGSVFSSPATASGNASTPFVKNSFNFIVDVNILPGSTYTLAWTVTTGVGQGAADHFALDNVGFSLNIPENGSLMGAAMTAVAIAGTITRRALKA